MIGVIRNGMNLLNIDAFVQLMVIGVVIAVAVEMDVVRGVLESRARTDAGRSSVSDTTLIAGDACHAGPRQGAGESARRGRPSSDQRFGAVLALDHVDLKVRRGEVLALLGDNGAGKSTLIKCLSGVHRLDGGVIEIDGRSVDMRSPADARAHGIETVYQDLALFDNLGPAANFYAGRELAGPRWLPRGLRFLHTRAMTDATREVRVGCRCSSRTKVHGRPHVRWPATGCRGGQGRRIQLPGGHPRRADAALGLRESRRVLDLIVRLRQAGHAVIVISHAMDHVSEVADRAVVMRRGRVVGEVDSVAEGQARILALIMGGDA